MACVVPAAAAVVFADSVFQASDGAKLFVRHFSPPAGVAPKAYVHLHHGLGDHSQRYIPFATRLAQEGFVVVAHDARGHGRSATLEGAKGYGMIEPGSLGVVPRMVADFEELLQEGHKKHPGLPVYLFGHSFGTVITQLSAGAGAGGVPIAGIALSGPPSRFPYAIVPVFKLLIGSLHRYHGDMGTSKVPAMLSFDKWNQQTLAAMKAQQTPSSSWGCFSGKDEGAEPPTGSEWLNRDHAEVLKYLEDPACGFDMCMAFWGSAVGELARLRDPATHAGLPSDLPVLVVSGESDFCTIDDFGVQSWHHIQQELAAARKTPPKVVIYPGARHELLLELCKQEVTDDLVEFFSSCVRRQHKAA